MGQRPSSLLNSRGPWTWPQTPVGLPRVGPVHHHDVVSRGELLRALTGRRWGSRMPRRPGELTQVEGQLGAPQVAPHKVPQIPHCKSRHRVSGELHGRAQAPSSSPLQGWPHSGTGPSSSQAAQTTATLRGGARPPARSRPHGCPFCSTPDAGLARPPPCRGIPPLASDPARYPIPNSALGGPS